MTKAERLHNALVRARFFHDQCRWAEARMGYEKIIEELMPKKKPSKKPAATQYT